MTKRTFQLLLGGLSALAMSTVGAQAQTVGPSGEEAVLSASVAVTDEQAATLQGMDLRAALLWHDQSDFVNAVTAGATDEFTRLGIDIVATASAGFDSAKQLADVETAMALSPDIILSLPLDPTASAAAFAPANEAGVSLVFLSNLPVGYVRGEDYAAIVTDDLFQMGRQAADVLAAAIGGAGEVGWIYHDATYYVTNQRDNAFKTTIETDHPGISIVAEAGIADPARAEEIANAMLLQNPGLDGIYVTWAGPAEGVLAALRTAGNTTTKVVTLDLSEPIALDMVNGGNVIGVVADEAYELGRAMAAAAALDQLDIEVPGFVVAPALTVTADNVAEGWQQSLRRDAPQSVLDAIQ